MVNRGFDPAERVQTLTEDGSHRQLTPADRVAERVNRARGPPGSLPVLDGTDALVFSSENYLGLTTDQRVQDAASQAAKAVGTGAGGSRVVAGDTLVHHDLERLLAATIETERALTVPSRDDAYRQVMSALEPDVIFADRHCPPVVDACATLTGCQLLRHDHDDPTSLAAQFRERANHDPAGEESWLLVTESVCPYDGAVRSLAQLADLAAEFGAWTLVDETHAVGLYANGGGVVQAEDCADDIDVQLGSLSTTLASQGGYVAASAPVIETVVSSPEFDATSALTPTAAATASEALHVARRGSARDELWENVSHLRDGLEAIPLTTTGRSQIVSIPLDDDVDAEQRREELESHGILVRTASPPTESAGTDRLVVTPLATHDSSDIVECLRAFEAVDDRPAAQ